MKTDSFLYLASPYNHETARMRSLRAKSTARVTGHLLRQGICVFSPIIHNHQLKISGALKEWTHRDYIAYDFSFTRVASGILVCKLPGWKTSKGILQEVEDFRNQHKPEFHYDPRPLFTTQEWADLGGMTLHTEVKPGEMAVENLPEV